MRKEIRLLELDGFICIKGGFLYCLWVCYWGVFVKYKYKVLLDIENVR